MARYSGFRNHLDSDRFFKSCRHSAYGENTDCRSEYDICLCRTILFHDTCLWDSNTGAEGISFSLQGTNVDIISFSSHSEVTRTIALAIRLFGNMLSGDMIAFILLGIVGFLIPVPFNLLHIVIGIIQAYIFGVLTLVFIAGGIRSQP